LFLKFLSQLNPVTSSHRIIPSSTLTFSDNERLFLCTFYALRLLFEAALGMNCAQKMVFTGIPRSEE
jgi:hypothetical protein